MAGASPLINLHDYAARARELLAPEAWAYLAGGAADELTLADNGRAWQAWRLLPRVLAPLAAGHTQIELLGRRWAHPIGLAPVAAHQLFHPEAEVGTVLAAAMQGAACTISSQASRPWRQLVDLVRSESTRGPLWAQAYWQGSQARTLQLIEHAAQAGMEAIVFTVDAPVHGARDRERRAGFVLPAELSKANAVPGVHPPAPAFAHPPLCDGLLAHAPDWRQLEALVRASPLPLIVKGLLHPLGCPPAHANWAQQQAGSATTAGARWTARSAPAPPCPRSAKRLARFGPCSSMAEFGAARMCSRPWPWEPTRYSWAAPPSKASPSMAPAAWPHVLRLLRDELEIAMALCGAATPDALTPELLVRA